MRLASPDVASRSERGNAPKTGELFVPAVSLHRRRRRYSLGGLEAAEYVLGICRREHPQIEETSPIRSRPAKNVPEWTSCSTTILHSSFDRPSGTQSSDSTATIAGFVRDQTAVGLSRVQLRLSNDEDRRNQGWNRNAATDLNGQFRFDDVLPGRYR
jgi:hypothetical protein